MPGIKSKLNLQDFYDFDDYDLYCMAVGTYPDVCAFFQLQNIPNIYSTSKNQISFIFTNLRSINNVKVNETNGNVIVYFLEPSSSVSIDPVTFIISESTMVQLDEGLAKASAGFFYDVDDPTPETLVDEQFFGAIGIELKLYPTCRSGYLMMEVSGMPNGVKIEVGVKLDVKLTQETILNLTVYNASNENDDYDFDFDYDYDFENQNLNKIQDRIQKKYQKKNQKKNQDDDREPLDLSKYTSFDPPIKYSGTIKNIKDYGTLLSSDSGGGGGGGGGDSSHDGGSASSLKSGLKGGAIAAIVICVIVVIAAAAVVGVFFFLKKKKTDTLSSVNSQLI